MRPCSSSACGVDWCHSSDSRMERHAWSRQAAGTCPSRPNCLFVSDSGHVNRSAHGTYLGATGPQFSGNVTQGWSLNTWETFVIDHVDKTKLTIETSHDTFLAAQASMDHPRKVMTMDRASLWELWTPWVNASTGGVCFQVILSRQGLGPGNWGRDFSLLLRDIVWPLLCVDHSKMQYACFKS